MATGDISDSLHTVFDGMACPRCDCNDATKVQTVDLGFGSFIRSCNLCNWSTGIDDSANLCDLDQENWEFEPNDDESGFCLENTSHYPICMGFSKFGMIGSRCMKCKKTGIMFYKGKDFNSGNEQFQDTDSVFDTIFKNITEKCEITNETKLLSDMQQEFSEDDKNSECIPPMDVDQGDDMAFECDCGNNNPESITKIRNSFGSVKQLRCCQCFANYSLDLDSNNAYIVCEKCGNNVEECFEITCESEKLTKIKCIPCGTAQTCSETNPMVFENTNYIHKARVCSWGMIERGNHISWQRPLSYEHHAIVLSIDPDENKVKVVEYGFKLAIINGKPKLAVVQEREETIEDLGEIFLYRYDYDPENCYPPEKVIERALGRIEERLYNVFERNCEHFATWCKTGRAFCSQIIPFVKRCGVSAVAFISQLSRPLINLIKDEVFQMIVSGAAVDDVVDFTAQQILGLKVDKAFMIGRIGFTVLLNVIVELCMFYHNYSKAKIDFEVGKITKTEFHKRKFELIGESIGGLTLGLLLGFTWLFGLGIIWTLILNILGIAVGCLCGSWIGRKLHNLKLKAK